MYIFNAITCKVASGYNLRDILEQVDELKFQTSEQRHELTYLYESSLNKMGNAGRNGGEYYTPRPLIRSIIKVVDPKIGETVYDGACGSAGFLCEAYSYMHDKVAKTADETLLQTSTFYGKELKELADKPEEKAKFIAEKEKEYNDKFSNPYNAARYGYIDDVIEPRNTRFRIIRALQSLATKRLQNPAKKHSNIPL